MSREAFEKWYQSIDKRLPVKNKELYWSYIGWQACAEEKDKRIAELESKLARLEIRVRTGTSPVISKLTAQNKELVESLEGLYEDNMDYIRLNNLGAENNTWLVIAREALAKVKGD